MLPPPSPSHLLPFSPLSLSLSLSLSSQKEIDVITKSYVSTVCEVCVTHNYVGLRWRLVTDLRRQQLQPSEPTAVCTVPTPRPARPALRREVSLSLDQGLMRVKGALGPRLRLCWPLGKPSTCSPVSSPRALVPEPL